MQTKLTLRLEQRLIKRAKEYAKAQGKSLSQIVADYFALLDSTKKEDRDEITPLVRSLKGVLRGNKIDIDDYYKYLEDKHL